MSLVASRVALTHRTSIERATSTDDSWGQPGSSTWAAIQEDVPCYATTSATKEAVTADRTAVVIDLRCIVPLDTDVTEQDRLGDITERGAVIYEGPLGIEAVLRYPTHLELMLTGIR